MSRIQRILTAALVPVLLALASCGQKAGTPARTETVPGVPATEIETKNDTETEEMRATDTETESPETDGEVQTMRPDTETAKSTETDAARVKRIEVTNILQNPELPTGCETVSLTILLNHLGFRADKMDLARYYLLKMDFYWKDGELYGADFRTTFAGNPESDSSYGCYAPCIVQTANSYLWTAGKDAKAYDLIGTPLEDLLHTYIDHDMPVLIWITSSNLHETRLTTIWTTPEGEKLQWIAYEHCVVLTGYDLDKGLIYVSDPLVGNTSYDLERLKARYGDLGRQAVRVDPEG